MGSQIDRRKYIYLVGGLVVGGAAGVAGGYVAAPPKEVVTTKTETSTVTAPATTVTAPATTITQTKTAAAAPTHVTYVHTGWGGDTALELIEDYKAVRPQAEVEYVVQPFEQWVEKLGTVFAAGGPTDKYDCVYTNINWMREWVDAGWLAPIDDYIKDYNEWWVCNWNDMWPANKQDLTYKNHIWGIPWYTSTGVCFLYNTKMLKDAGIEAPPKNWDELVEQSVTVQKKGLVPEGDALTFSLSMDIDTYSTILAIMANRGGRFFDEKGQPEFNKPICVDTLELLGHLAQGTGGYTQIIAKASFEGEMDYVIEILAAAKSCFQYNGSWYMRVANDPAKSKVPGQVYTAVNPRSPDANAKFWVPGAGATGGIWVIPADSVKYRPEVTEEVYRYMEFIGGYPGHKKWAMQKALFPSFKASAADPEVLASEAMAGTEVWAKQIDEGGIAIMHPYWFEPVAKFSHEFQVEATRLMQMAVMETMNAQEAMDELAVFYDKKKKELA